MHRPSIDNVSNLFQKCHELYNSADRWGIVDFASHPFTSADLLIRIGYEPFPPIEKRSLFTFYNPELMLPGLLKYARYLVYADAPLVYSPFPLSLTEKLMKAFVQSTLEKRYKMEELSPSDTIELHDQLEQQNFVQFFCTRSKSFLIQIGVTISTHPIRVIIVRCVASFVEKDEGFTTPLACILTTWKNEGISGFFRGLAPRLVADFVFAASSAMIYASIVRGVRGRADLSEEQFTLFEKSAVISSEFIANNWAQQYRNVSDLLIVNGTRGLAIGNPPYISVYKSWFDCWTNIPNEFLYKKVSVFDRSYKGPLQLSSTAQNGHLIPALSEHFGPTHGLEKDVQTIPFLLTDYYAVAISNNKPKIAPSEKSIR